MNLCYAGLWKRLSAFLLDFLIIGAYILVLLGIGIGFNVLTGGTSLLASPIAMNILAFVILVLPVILYFALQESSVHQATFGKRRAKIKVANNQGGRIDFWQALVRSAIKFLPWQLAHMSVIYVWYSHQSSFSLFAVFVAEGLAIVYVIGLWFSKKHRTLYDLITGTFVIMAR